MLKKNKIKTFLIVSLLLILIAGLYIFLDYLEYRKETNFVEFEIYKFIEHESIDNYEIIETDKGKMVVNEKAGLSFMVPDNWRAEKNSEIEEIELFSFDVDLSGIGLETTFPRNGCIIKTGIVRFIDNYSNQTRRPEIITDKIEGREELIEDIQEIISIDKRLSLKTIRFKSSDAGRIIFIETPLNDEIYHFGISFPLISEEECLKSFNKFLETISIENKL